jgi:hypothetical protein
MRTEEFPKALQARAAIYAQSSTVPAQPVEPTDYRCAIAQCHCSSLRSSLNSRSVRHRFDDSSRWRSFHIVAQFKLREHISDVAKLSSGHNLPVRCCNAEQHLLQHSTMCCACNAVQCVATASSTTGTHSKALSGLAAAEAREGTVRASAHCPVRRTVSTAE